MNIDTDFIYDVINDNINTNPDIIFRGLQFNLKKFDFDKDIIFKNMTQIKDNELSFRLMVAYEFNYDNIIEKLKELFPSGIVNISGGKMFIQLYLYLIKNNFEKRFIFKRELFESTIEAMYKSSSQTQIDKGTHMIYMLYINNYSINKLLQNVKCFYDHINIIKTGENKDGIACYTGLTPEGVKTMIILDWAKYLNKFCKEFFIEKKRINDIEYESDTRELCTLERDELDKHMKIYSTKKNLITLNNYYDIGYFDIWEFSNGLTKVAINVEKEKIIDIAD